MPRTSRPPPAGVPPLSGRCREGVHRLPPSRPSRPERDDRDHRDEPDEQSEGQDEREEPGQATEGPCHVGEGNGQQQNGATDKGNGRPCSHPPPPVVDMTSQARLAPARAAQDRLLAPPDRSPHSPCVTEAFASLVARARGRGLRGSVDVAHRHLPDGSPWRTASCREGAAAWLARRSHDRRPCVGVQAGSEHALRLHGAAGQPGGIVAPQVQQGRVVVDRSFHGQGGAATGRFTVGQGEDLVQVLGALQPPLVTAVVIAAPAGMGALRGILDVGCPSLWTLPDRRPRRGWVSSSGSSPTPSALTCGPVAAAQRTWCPCRDPSRRSSRPRPRPVRCCAA